jgi:putative acetyltransferase
VKIGIRPYQDSDCDAVMNIWEQASKQGHPFLGSEEIAFQKEIVRTEYLGKTSILVATDSKKQVIGFIGLLDSFVGALFVLPDMQGERIGTSLIEKAREEKGFLSVEVYKANQKALHFYHHLGFISQEEKIQYGKTGNFPIIHLQQEK